jgi:hypothetical protein
LFYLKDQSIIGYSYYNNSPSIFNVTLKLKNDLSIITRNFCDKIFLARNKINSANIQLIRDSSTVSMDNK